MFTGRTTESGTIAGNGNFRKRLTGMSMAIRVLRLVSYLCLVLLVLSAPVARADQSPNVVYILANDLGWGWALQVLAQG